MTTYLKFPTQAAFLAVMPADWQQSGETGAPLPGGIEAIYIVGAGSGKHYDMSTLTLDDGGNVKTPPTLVAGYHVNVLGTLPAAWKKYEIKPATPSAVFG
jgi:hypothetical protein